MKYYISRGGQQYGPYSIEDLQGMKTQGRVDANDYAWAEGMASWTPLSQILDSASAAAPAPAAAATPQAYTPPQQPQPAYTPPQQQYTPPQQQYTPPQQQYTPPQQQYTPPQQQYTPPQQQQYAPQQQYTPQAAYGAAPQAAYAGAAYNAGYTPQPAAGAPMPPNVHWIVAWLIAPIWVFIEASFVKKIDPQSKGMKYISLWILSAVGGLVVYMVLINVGIASHSLGLVMVGAMVFFAAMIMGAIFSLLGVFNMRTSIVNYYNSVEPIGLRLSGVMTFFFNIIYFQYHFSRIARWKQTGRLE